MNGLEMPLVFARYGVHRDHRISEQVHAFSISAIVIRRWGRYRQIHNAALLIHRLVEAPYVGAGAVLPTVAIPGVVARFARLWHRMKVPQLRSRAGIVSAPIARRTQRRASWVRAHDHSLLEDGRDGYIWHRHIHLTFLAEAGIESALGRIQGDQPAPGGEEDARRIAAVAWPVRHAAP